MSGSNQDWIKVDGYKDMPVGFWLVEVDESWHGLTMHTAAIRKNMSVIGGHFAFDMGRVLRYRPLPEVPERV